MDIYGKAVTLTPAKDKFYSQIKELNELQLSSSNGISCVEDLDTAYKTGLAGAALGDVFYHTRKLNFMKYEEAMNTPNKPYWEDDVETEHNNFL